MIDVWIDRGCAVHGGVDVRTVWRKIGREWKRASVHALIRLPDRTEMKDLAA